MSKLIVTMDDIKRYKVWWLIAMIDDTTNEVFYAGLIKEIRLAGIKDYDEANMYLVEKFLPYYNARFTHEAESAYMPLPKDTDLDLIFCIKRQRTVNKDNTISFRGTVERVSNNGAIKQAI